MDLNSLGIEPLRGGDPTAFGEFTVAGRFGGGGMAELFLVEGGSVGQAVVQAAVEAADPIQAAARMSREVEAMRLVGPPSVPAVIASELDGPRPWIAMDYVRGPTLRQLLAGNGPLEGAELDDFALRLAEVLSKVHRVGVVDCDLKPEDVIFTCSGVRLRCLGAAEVDGATGPAPSGSLVGTAEWIAPEQMSGDPITSAVDVHSWGLLVLFAATGQTPFASNTVVSSIYRVLNHVPDVPPSIQGALRGLVERAVRKDPAQRPSADEITQDLRERLRSDDGANRESSFSERHPATPAAIRRLTVRGKPGRRVAMLIGVVVLPLLLGMAAAVRGPLSMVTAPDVAGQTRETAKLALSKARLGIDAELSEYSEKFPAGQIIRTDPVPGTRTRRGTKVVAIVSRGPERYQIPDLSGMTARKAASALIDAHLSRGDSKAVYSERIKKGRVISQDPAIGKSVRPGTPVDVVVSKGREPIHIPYLAGKAEGLVSKMLTDLGLKVSVIRQHNQIAKGKAISSKPGAGSTVHRGDLIELLVSIGPQTPAAWSAPTRLRANAGGGTPQFPSTVPGYRLDHEWSETVRTFAGSWVQMSGEDPDVDGFPNSMNGCADQRFLVRWRGTYSDPPIVTATSSLAMGPLESPRPDTSSRASGSSGWMVLDGCTEPLFSLGKARAGSPDDLMDVVVEVQRWSASVG